MKKKLVSVFLTLCMVLTLLPTMALATGGVMTVQIGSGAATPYQSFEAGWNAAVGGASGEVTVTLLADWTAQDGSYADGDCKGFTMTGGSITNNRCRRCYEGTWCFRFGKGSC